LAQFENVKIASFLKVQQHAVFSVFSIGIGLSGIKYH